MPDFPLTMLEAGKFDKNVPIVIGHNTNEFFAGLGKKRTEAEGTHFAAWVPDWLDGKVSFPLKDDDAAPVLSHMLGIPVSNATVQRARATYYPQSYFRNPTERIAQMLIDSGAWIGHAHDRRAAQAVARYGGTAYQYHFAHKGKFETVGHFSEVPYVFQLCGALLPVTAAVQLSCQGAGLLPSSTELAIMHGIGAYWTQFARYGDPNNASATLPHWPVYDTIDDTTVLLDSQFGTESKYRADADAFWRSALVRARDWRG